jgi:capsular exopolysaccharide synthesis family protein
MDLQSFIAVVWRRRLVVVITTGLALAATIAGLFLITPLYTASTTLRMGTANTGSSGWVSYDLQYSDRLMNTYRTMVTSPQTSAEVMKELNLSAPPKIAVTIPANTELMVIHVQDTNPKQAADAANAIADQLSTQIKAQYASLGESSLDLLKQQIDQVQADLDKQRAQYDTLLKQSPDNKQLLDATQQSIQLDESTYSTLLTQYQELRDATAQGASMMSVVQEASVPTAPSNPNKKILIPLGLMLGIIGGTGLAFLLENFDTTMYSSDGIAKLVELPIIGRIPTVKRPSSTGLFLQKSPQEEAFRRLRTTLFALDPETGVRSLMITSSQPSEGKSTTVANLALAIAQSGRRVIVVDGDLRKPVQHEIFEIPNEVGLTSVLSGEADVNDAIRYNPPHGINVLPSGPASPAPAELLGLPAMHDVIEYLSKSFEFVLVDAPSLQTVADATVLSLIVDGLVVVVARGEVRRETLDAALNGLAGVHRKPLGIIVTHAEISSEFHYDRPIHATETTRTPSGPAPAPEEDQHLIRPLRVIRSATSRGASSERDSGRPRHRLDDLTADPVAEATEEEHVQSGPAVLRRISDFRTSASTSRTIGGSLECFDNDKKAVNGR